MALRKFLNQKKNQQVCFNDEVERHEFEQELSLDIIDEFIKVPFKDPRKGYNLSIRSASFLGVYDLVERIIAEDANCVNVPNKHGWTALMYAAQGGNVDICQLLLQHGARLDVKNGQGQDAYELAKNWGHKRVMDLIKAKTYLRQSNNGKK
ncbi:hypothetical protein niasHT_023182 [Heterodera trifolii]|uniref:Ankyrin repeat domain-containing protein n=1 Tax=Heterodera trifolii TaxID=157864 RepID=A0ABD2JD70_9BILA